MQTKSSSQASGTEDDEKLDLDELLEKDMLWAEADQVGDVSETVLFAMRTLVTAADFEVPVSKKRYVELLRSFVIETQAARRESKAASRELGVQKAKEGDLELKVQLLTDAA